jgi:hypothetical protein
MSDDTLRISFCLIRPSSDPYSKALIQKFWDNHDWRPCTCVRCGERFKSRRPRTFVVVSFPAYDDGKKSYGICRRCEKAPDDEIMKAAGVYVQKYLGADGVSAVH